MNTREKKVAKSVYYLLDNYTVILSNLRLKIENLRFRLKNLSKKHQAFLVASAAIKQRASTLQWSPVSPVNLSSGEIRAINRKILR